MVAEPNTGGWSRGRCAAWGSVLILSLVLAAAKWWPAAWKTIAADNQKPADARVSGGALLIVGGGEVTQEIRRRFVELAGGPQARIVVIPASEPGADDVERWLRPWRSLGVSHCEMLHAADRSKADSSGFCEPLTKTTGVWFTGGRQAFLAERYVDTAVEKCLRDLLTRKGVVGGTSAGAAILSRVMIVEGSSQPVEARGLGLLDDAVIDQHFLKRNRIWRLQQVLKSHPELVGFGIDERTALIVRLGLGRLEVVGPSYVMACVPGADPHPFRFEVLQAGDEIFLESLREAHRPYRPPVDWDEVTDIRTAN